MTTRRRPATFTVVKDAITFCAGLGIMGQQLLFVAREDFNLVAWISALVLVGVPGASQLLPSLGQILGRGDTSGGSSSLPSPESLPQSPASSTTSQGPDP